MRIDMALDKDLEDVFFVERTAFGEEDEATIVAELLEDPSARPILSLIARDDGRPVGHIMFSAARLRGASRDVSIAILAPLAVVPDAQGRGIGGMLIEEGVARLGASGVKLVFLAGHPSYYPRHGFESASSHGLAAPYPVIPDEGWMVRPLRPDVLGTVSGRIECADSLSRPEYWRE